ncbi:MAG: homogentisate 1 2-dioxygenase, partial [Halothiobacillaceae bacterium]
MSQWITLPRSEGETSRQAHTDLPAGSCERELGREGFFGPATQMYHRHPPTGWNNIEGPLRPRAFDTTKLSHTSVQFWEAAQLLGNEHLLVRLWHHQGRMDHLVRNADGDDLLFIHQGSGELYCDYGHLSLREGDYINLPRGTAWRIDSQEPLTLLAIEATHQSFTLPDKGLVGHHAIFDPAVLDTPKMNEAFLAQQSDNPWQIVVKRRNQLTTLSYPFNPLDARGWHGTLMP